ncbi:MAG: DUF547 domain-containing protein [Planctomycetota bacterium]|nr:MAG: DUF547 domain-containing protein [Planctomycetota bacterium]
MIKRLTVFTTLMAVLIFISSCSPEKPKSAKPAKVEPLKPTPIVSFHDKCADILKNYVDDNGMVDYKTLNRKKAELNRVLDEFRNLAPEQYNRWPKEDKIAFWLNAYNIELLNIIIENYPIKAARIRLVFWPPTSIRHIRGIWDRHKFMVMNEEFTLAEIEKRFFQKQFDEPRVFFAMHRASYSGPPLRNEPYSGDKLDSQLDDQVRKFLSSPLAFRIDREKKRVYLSALLKSSWHGTDFISKYGTDKKFKDQQPAVRAVLNFITNYVSEQDVYFLETENYSVRFLKYDWRLNE